MSDNLSSRSGIPHWLYYTVKTAEATLTQTQTGNIDFDALLQGKPAYWIKDEAKTLKKRLLIVNDFYLALLTQTNAHLSNTRYVLDLVNIFERLEAEGFEIVIADIDNFKLKKLSLYDLEKLSLDIKITPFKDLPIPAHLTKEEYCILDYFDIRRLRSEMLDTIPKDKIEVLGYEILEVSTTLKQHELKKLQHQIQTGLLTKILPKAIQTRKLTDLHQDICRTETPIWDYSIQDCHDTLHLDAASIKVFDSSKIDLSRIKIVRLYITNQDCLSFASEYLRQLTNLKELEIIWDKDVSTTPLNNLTLSPRAKLSRLVLYGATKIIFDNYSDLKSVYIRNCDNLDNAFLNQILQSASQLESLYLIECTIQENILDAEFAQLQKLTKLNLNDTTLSQADFLSLLRLAPELQTLSIESTGISDLTSFTYKSKKDGKIRRLYAKDCVKNSCLVTYLIESNPKVEEIHHDEILSILEDNYSDEESSAIPLREVKTLISYGAITRIPLPKLENLQIKDLEEEQESSIYSIDAPKLKHLSLKNSSLGVDNLIEVFCLCPEIESLDLTEFKFLNNTSLNSPFQKFPSLTQLNLSETNINIETLLYLLSHFPNLEKLILDDTNDLNLFNIRSLEQPITLPKLNYLSCLNSNADYQLIVKLIASSTHLKILALNSNCLHAIFLNNGEIEKLISSLNLTHIEKLHLQDGQLSDPELLFGLCVQYKTSELTLENFAFPFSRALNLDIYTSLRSCQLVNCQLNNQSLFSLLIHSPNLELISLYNCEGIDLHAEELKPFLNKIDFVRRTTPLIKTSALIDTPQSSDKSETPNFNVEKIFYAKPGTSDPDIRMYRLNIYNKILLNEKTLRAEPQPFILNYVFDEQALIPCEVNWATSQQALIDKRNTSDKTFYYGTKILNLSSHWTRIPSHSCDEKLTDFFMNHIDNSQIEIQYNKRECFYYIRTKNNYNTSCRVHFLVEALPKPALPIALQSLRSEYQGYQDGTLILPKNKKEYISGQDCYLAIKKQKVGACRHRAGAFMYDLQEGYDDAICYYVDNDCHAFTEVQSTEQRYTCDLGGTPAELTINEHDINSEVCLKQQSQALSLKLNPAKFTSPPKSSFIPANKTLIQENILLENKNILIDIKSTDSHAITLFIKKTCIEKAIPVFMIQSPADINCSANWVKIVNNQGELMPGPGGKLFEFIQQNKKHHSVILINFLNFEADDIAGFNTIIDTPRVADGTLIPSQFTIVGLYDREAPGAYLGKDFTSRFKIKLTYKTAEPDILELPSKILCHQDSSHSQLSPYPIKLFHIVSWKEILLGKLVYQNLTFPFLEGELSKALKSQRPIQLINAPWECDEFRILFEDLLLNKKIPGLSFVSHYDWHLYKQKISLGDFQPDENTFVLNQSTYSHLFNQYVLINNTLSYQSGLLKQHHDSPITLLLTQNLNTDQWARILDLCDNFNNHIALILSNPDLSLPEELGLRPSEQVNPTPPMYQTHENINTIYTNDTELTILKIKQESKLPIETISISEMSFNHLSIYCAPKFNEGELKPNFNIVTSEIWKKLTRGESLILKGSFSQELINHFACLIFQSKITLPLLDPKTISGKLFLVSENADDFHFVKSKHVIHSVQDKKNELTLKYGNPLIDKFLDMHPTALLDFNYTKLCHLLAFLKHYPNKLPLDVWHSPEAPVTQITYDFTINDLTKEKSDLFEQERFSLIEKAWELAPFIDLSGVSGVGKSTFVSFLSNLNDYTVYFGEDSFEQWANDISPNKKKVLFLDEINLGLGNCTEFEGLFETPPVIYKTNKRYPLSPEHLVIFARNPLSYGGERHLPEFFKNHSNPVIFKPMSPAFVYQKTIKPFNFSNQINLLLVDIYYKITNLNPDEVLITPRELELLSQFIQNQPHSNTKNYSEAILYSYLLGISVLSPEQKNQFSLWFEQKYLAITQLLETHTRKTIIINKFLVTPSRYPTYLLMKNLLEVSEKNQSHAGLGGMLIEGNPGDGKSHFLINMLNHMGYHKANFNDTDMALNKRYYVLPASMSFKLKTQYLLQAFHEGSKVILDEANSSPALEQLVNALLTGVDLQNKRAAQPGFKLFLTQNPAKDFEGRKATSTAIKRRVINCVFEPYSEAEIVAILVSKGLPNPLAVEKASAFKQNQSVPTFRELETEVEDYLQSIQAVIPPKVLLLSQSITENIKPESLKQLQIPSLQIKY
jgi:hypothetical protein